MRNAPSHQWLKSRGLVLDYETLDEVVAAFVSHQWCGSRSADPHFKQLRVLQGVIRRAAEGNLDLSLDIVSKYMYHQKQGVRAAELRDILSWTLWYDYFSVPQPDALEAVALGTSTKANLSRDLGLAVASLATYVQSCAYFFILAPFVQHEAGHYLDYAAWKSRGWCRLERLARVMSPGATSLLHIGRGDTVFEVGPEQYLFDPVGKGSFTNEEDRGRLGPLVQRLLEVKLSALLASGRMEEYRNLVSWCPLLLEGLEGVDWREVCPYVGSAKGGDRFWELLRLPRGDVRPAAVLLAAACGEVEVLRAMAAARADLECAERRSSMTYFRFPGRQPLHMAAASGHTSTVAFLLDSGVAVNRTDKLGRRPLHTTAFCGSVEVARMLLEHRADIDARCRSGIAALQTAAFRGHLDLCRFLLEARCSAQEPSSPGTALHSAAFLGSGMDTIHLLVEGGVSPSSTWRVGRGAERGAYILVGLPHRLGSRSLESILGYHAIGATPLHVAVMMSNWGEVRALLDARADPEARNCAGAAPRDVARAVGAPGRIPFQL